MPRPHARALVALAAVALAATACGSSASSTTTTSAAAAPSGGATTTAPAALATSNGPWPASPAGTFGTKPTVVVPSVGPPSKLVVHDLIVGTGAVAKPGDTVEVQYVGVSYTTRKQFDVSWDDGQPFSFALDSNPPSVITGWDVGVAGMRVGGRRELIIPPSLGYGAKSPGAGIVANDTLIFVVDLLKVTPAGG